MNDDNDAEAVKRLLRERGFQGKLEEVDALEEGAPLEEPTRPEDDPIHALDLNTYTEDQIQKFPLPKEAVADLQPEEKSRLLREPSFAGEVETPKDPWTRSVSTLGKVTVSDEEREEYLRALLMEERFEIPLHLTIGKDTPFNVHVRSLYASEKEVVALAVERVVENYPIRSLKPDPENPAPFKNMALAMDYFLRLSIMTQVTQINGEPQGVFDARTEPGQLPEQSPKVEELAEAVRTRFANIHQAKFRILVQALHLFQTKQLILEDAMVNRDFWKPADTN